MRITGKKLRAGEKAAGDVDARCHSFVSRCRALGIRLTTQRMAVFRALLEDTTHPTVDSVYAAVRKTMPSLPLSTIYRILESLEREGLIRRVSTYHGVARFDANLDPHQHLHCRICGRMTDFEEESLSRLRLPSIKYAGFMPEELDIRVVGSCAGCRRATSNAKNLLNRKVN